MIKGCVSRLIKPSNINGNIVKATAFDLREVTPPETYVSFFKVGEGNKESKYILGYKSIVSAFKNSLSNNAAIALISIEECLENINDEDEALIEFKEKMLPHCGLYYLTSNLSKINEIKTTLAYLANINVMKVPEVKSLQKVLEK